MPVSYMLTWLFRSKVFLCKRTNDLQLELMAHKRQLLADVHALMTQYANGQAYTK